MDKEALKTKATCLLRRAGLSDVPIPALMCSAAVAVVLVVVGLWQFGFGQDQAGGSDFEIVAGSEGADEAADSADDDVDADSLAVDVEGCVKSPGLYELDASARVGDAIDAAGGLKRNAARSRLNLAQKLEDGQQVYVQSKKQAAREQTTTSGSAGTSDTGAGSNGAQSSGTGGGTAASKININTSDAAELQKLNGIGESISQRIIDYREKNGSFSKVEDLKKVSGIGEARFAAIKDDICV